MAKLSELKTLHDLGLSLIYLREGEKRPIEGKWTSGKRKTWAEIESAYSEKHNIGVRLGHTSKLSSGLYLGAIDCDVKSDDEQSLKEMRRELEKLGFNFYKHTGPMVKSGRGNGSLHVYVQTKEPMQPQKYKTSPDVVKVSMPGTHSPFTKRELEGLTEEERKAGMRFRPAWEIAFMGEGQQTVLPPSTHPDTGLYYSWKNPLLLKTLPEFEPSRFVSQKEKTETAEIKLDFEAEEVNLWESKMPTRYIKQIEDMKNVEDRSHTAYVIAVVMCKMGFTDNQILSVLSDPKNKLAQVGYDHTQSKSRARVVKWLHKYTLTRARNSTDIMRRFERKPPQTPSTEKETVALKEEIKDVVDRTLPDLDKSGKPKNTLKNILHILEVFMGGGVVGWDEFKNRAMFLKDTPYGGKKGREITDKDDLALKVYLSKHFRFEPPASLCYEAHSHLANKYAFHPVRTFLNSLEWDQVPRLDQWLKTGFKAKAPAGYLEAVSRKTLVAAVARIFTPGIKFDHVLVLEGFQGKGKSTALRILGGDDWFTDSLGDIHQKDVVDQMAGKWIIEIAELATFKGRDVDLLKSFITRQVDRVRLPYGKRSEDFSRQSIFIGSTNNNEYFNDETGNRRFWPVSIDQADFKWLKKNRNQLWAEAVHYFRAGEPIFLTEEVEALAIKEQSKRYVVDELEYDIKQFLNETMLERFTIQNIWEVIHPTAVGKVSEAEIRRIGKVMRRLGHARKTVRFPNGVRTMGYEILKNE